MKEYPASFRQSLTESLHGISVPDPYRWLEDIDSPDSCEWVATQSRFTKEYLQNLPGCAAIKNRLEELWNFERFDLPVQRGERLFYMSNSGLQNQPVMYVQDGLEGKPRLLLDPNTLSTDGTLSLTGYQPDPAGKRVAYSVAAAGSDWNKIFVLDVASIQPLDDCIEWVKFSSISWRKDGSGFYYSRYDAPQPGEDLKETNYFQKIFYHQIGTSQNEDQLIHHDPVNKQYGFNAEVSEDGRFLVFHVWHGTARENGIQYLDLDSPEIGVQTLTLRFDASYNFVGNEGSIMYFFTDLDAPRGRLIAIDLTNPDQKTWKEVIPQANDVLHEVAFTGGMFFARYLHDAHSQVVRFASDGLQLGLLALPGLGTVGESMTGVNFGGGDEAQFTFYQFTNFLTPPTIYRLDIKTGFSEIFRQPVLSFRPEDYELKQVFYSSRDGTRVPMFIGHKVGLKPEGQLPTLLYGYGGFNVSQTPAFSVMFLAWMEMGGVFALANLRGGGEYGKEWHLSGMLDHKQNVFDDFIAAGEYLVAHNYTSPDHLGVMGRSNGGLLIGAVMTQRPDLFGACIPVVGVMDMLRFHKFTIGWAWVSDYGSPEIPDEFKTLLAYSPYHNLKPRTAYPPTLVCTGDHDDRVFPAHSFKFAAALQHAQAGPKPVLIRIDVQAGHGMGKPVTKLVAETADQLAFLSHHLGLSVKFS